MATLYKRGDAYYLNWFEGGVQFRRSLGKVERKAAEALRVEKEAELRGLITPSRGVLVRDVLDVYLAWYRTERPTTYGRAVSALKRFRAEFDPASAEGLPPVLIERWTSRMTATGQAEKALKLARAAFRRAINQRMISRSPMDGVSIPKPLTSRAPNYYRPKQIAELQKTAHAAIWDFMLNTGIRRGEMAKATRSDVREGMLYVESVPEGRTKNARWRAIPLNAPAKNALKSLGDDKLVIAHKDTLSDWFAQESKEVGVGGTLHWLRHTFCTLLAQRGVSLFEIQRLAGHSSIAMTEKYAHHAPGFGRSAVDSLSDLMPKQHSKQHSRKAKTAKTRKAP